MADKKRLVVIDGKSVFYRGYYAMPNLATKEGQPTGGVYGFAVMALEVLKKMDPDFVCVAWDKPKTNIRRRREIYPEYKANRKPAPPDFYEQVPLLHELLDAFSWPLYEIDDHEADDIMGTFAVQAHAKGYETVLITSDHDVLQLVNGDVNVAVLKKGLSNVETFDPTRFQKRYRMTPEQFVDYKSLRGDSSDNIPGVAGIGEKTAIELIEEYGSLDDVYKHLDDIKPAVQKKLEAGKDMAYLTKKLVLLDTKVPLKLDWKQADIKNVDAIKVNKVLRDFEFRTLANQLPEHMKVDPSQLPVSSSGGSFNAEHTKSTHVRTAAQLRSLDLKNGKPLVVHSWSSDMLGKKIDMLIVSDKPEHSLVFDLGELKPADVAKALKSFLESAPLIGYDVKSTIKVLAHLGITASNVEHDVRMAAFLLNSLIREQALTKLAQDELGYEGPELDEVPPEERDHIAPTVTAALWQLYDKQVSELKELTKLDKLAKDIEWPVIPVLARMELEGITLDTDYLKHMAGELDVMISDFEQQIYGYADEEFNIASPIQLSEVLFEKLKLPTHGIKKTKTSYSTAATELDKLRAEHPIIDLISEYREVTKLKNTYVDVLPTLVDADSKLHTTFAIDVAPTGRLSSHDPNLQNIPVRSELGKKIRTAFVASKGHVFVSADYSQFELRLAATIAGDKELIAEFNKGLDIHTQTAAQVYGIDPKEVTKGQRRDAKVVNFGILYGMSPHGLSVATGMSNADAKSFIDKYFALRKAFLKYMEDTKKRAREQGYVETMFGRRRPTPDTKSSNFMVRSAAERAAINMPIQGTEADLMKMAMIEIDKKLPKGCRQLLQIHDSILVECPKADAKKVGDMLKKTMENIYKLPVKLDVDISVGKNWGEL